MIRRSVVSHTPDARTLVEGFILESLRKRPQVGSGKVDRLFLYHTCANQSTKSIKIATVGPTSTRKNTRQNNLARIGRSHIELQLPRASYDSLGDRLMTVLLPYSSTRKYSSTGDDNAAGKPRGQNRRKTGNTCTGVSSPIISESTKKELRKARIFQHGNDTWRVTRRGYECIAPTCSWTNGGRSRWRSCPTCEGRPPAR